MRSCQTSAQNTLEIALARWRSIELQQIIATQKRRNVLLCRRQCLHLEILLTAEKHLARYRETRMMDKNADHKV